MSLAVDKINNASTREQVQWGGNLWCSFLGLASTLWLFLLWDRWAWGAPLWSPSEKEVWWGGTGVLQGRVSWWPLGIHAVSPASGLCWHPTPHPSNDWALAEGRTPRFCLVQDSFWAILALELPVGVVETFSDLQLCQRLSLSTPAPLHLCPPSSALPLMHVSPAAWQSEASFWFSPTKLLDQHLSLTSHRT